MAVDRRKGLNATLTYSAGNSRRGFKVRCNTVVHGTEMIATESQARMRRAYYPHRLSPTQFAIGVECVGYYEHKALSSWLMEFSGFVLNPSLQDVSGAVMTVSVPSRDFMRKGIPVAGIEFGDRVGSMVFTPVIVFETAYDPSDPAAFRASKFDGSFAMALDRDVKYFYPLSPQLNGDDAPPNGAYATVALSAAEQAPPLTAVQAAVNGGTSTDRLIAELGSATGGQAVKDPTLGGILKR